MDPLGISPAIIHLLSLAGKTGIAINKLIKAAKDAPEELHAIGCEISALSSVLQRLELLIEEEKHDATISLDRTRSLLASAGGSDLKGPLDACLTTMLAMGAKMDHILKRLMGGRINKMKAPFSWSSALKDFGEMRVALERNKSVIMMSIGLRTFNIVLTTSKHFVEIQESLKAIQNSSFSPAVVPCLNGDNCQHELAIRSQTVQVAPQVGLSIDDEDITPLQDEDPPHHDDGCGDGSDVESHEEIARLRSIRLGKRKVEEDQTPQEPFDSAASLVRPEYTVLPPVNRIEDVSMIDDWGEQEDRFTPESTPERHVWQFSELATFSNPMELIARFDSGVAR